jgi:hypothetical protein
VESQFVGGRRLIVEGSKKKKDLTQRAQRDRRHRVRGGEVES